ncbi:MAG: T9SS type A sorting domain-containing protein [bacterium]|nr:T9SS type A sorting domain-containing protein [bacterium]
MKKSTLILAALLMALINVSLAEAEIVFQDDFSSGNLNNWTILNGSWSVINGEMCGTSDGARITPNTGTLTSYTFTCAARFQQGLAWGIDFRYIDPNNRLRLDFAPGAPNQLNVNVYQNGTLVAHPYGGTCSQYGANNTQHYCKFVVNGSNFQVYFGNDPNNLDLLCDTTFTPFSSGTIRYEVWGYPPNVLSCFDNVVISTPDNPQMVWWHTYDNLFPPHQDDYFNCVQETEPDHGYIMTGYLTGPPNGTQIRVMKTNQNGDILWDHSWGQPYGNDYGYWVEQTSDGGYIVTGNWYVDSYNCEAFLLKLYPDGNEEWCYTYGHGIEGDGAQCVRQTSDGGYIVAGGTYGSYIWDFWLFKVNSVGTLQWQQTFNMSGYQSASFVSPTNDGGYILSGYTTPDPWNALIIKTNSTGQMQWQNIWGGSTGQEWAGCVRQLPDGSYLASGMTSSYGAGGYDGVLYKISSTGVTQWYQTYGGPYDDELRKFQFSDDGQEVNMVGTISTSATNKDLWYLKTNLSGSTITSMNFGGTAEELGTGVDVTYNGIILAGGSKSYGEGDWDSYLVRLVNPINPTLDINITAINPTIVIPAGGGSFNYNINVHNLISQSQTFQVWTKAYHIASNTFYNMFGPIIRSLPGNANPTRELTQWINSTYPAGSSYYIGYIGTYPNTIVDSSYFSFTKSAVDDGGPWISESKCEGDFFDEYAVEPISVPQQMALLEAYPNPFNPATTITYTLPAATRVKLSVYNISGSLLATLVDGFRDAGVQQVTFNAAELPSGIYLARVESGSCSSVQKLVLMK